VDDADNTSSWSSGTVFQYITSLTQNAAVKPGTVFISRPLVSVSEDGSSTASALFTNGTALTTTSDEDPLAATASAAELHQVQRGNCHGDQKFAGHIE